MKPFTPIAIFCCCFVNAIHRNWDGTFQSLTQNTRTSSNTWCLEECYEDELNQAVIRRVENITDIPDGNSEYWQFLKYEVGQVRVSFYIVVVRVQFRKLWFQISPH
jgi:hypothetical protein